MAQYRWTDNSCAESSFVAVECFISGVVVMKAVLKVSVEIIRVCGEKRRSNWSSMERSAESEPPPHILLLSYFLCRDKTFATLHQRYYFSMMRQHIQMYIKYCEPCQMNNYKKIGKCPREMQPVKVPCEVWKQIGKDIPSKLFKLFHNFTYVVMKHYTIPLPPIHTSRFVNTSGVDLIRPLKEYEGKKYIATAVCYFTKFLEAKAIPNKTVHEVGTFIYELFCQ